MATLSDYQRDILARTILGEARGEGASGMAAVAQTILNRSRSGRFPDDPAKVALQDNQFSVWNNGAGSGKTNYDRSSTEYQNALQIVDAVASGSIPDQTNGALYYHNPSVSPAWANGVNQYGTTRIGNHIFYNGAPTPPRDIPNVVGTQLDVTRPRIAPTPASVEDRVTARNTAPPVVTPLQAALNQVATRERNRVTPASVEERVTARNTATARADAMADAARMAALRANQSFVGQDRSAPQVTQLPRMNVPTISTSDRARGQTGQFSGDPMTPASGRVVATIPSTGGPATSIRPSVQVSRPAVPSNITTQRNEQLATRQATPRAPNPQSQPSATPRVNPVGAMPTFQALQDMAAQRFDPNAPDRLTPSSAIIPTNVGSIPRSQVNQIGVPALLPAIGPARAPISVPASQLATRANIAPVPFMRPAMASILPQAVRAPQPILRQPMSPAQSPLTIRVIGSNTIPYPQPKPQTITNQQRLQNGRDAVSQSGDTSVGNQRDAAEARSSGAGGRTRRY